MFQTKSVDVNESYMASLYLIFYMYYNHFSRKMENIDCYIIYLLHGAESFLRS